MLSMQSSFGHLWIIELQSKPQHSLNQQFSTVLLAIEVPDGSSSTLERDKIAAGGCLGGKSSCRLWDIRLFVWLRATKRSTTATLQKFSNLPLPAKVKVKKLKYFKIQWSPPSESAVHASGFRRLLHTPCPKANALGILQGAVGEGQRWEGCLEGLRHLPWGNSVIQNHQDCTQSTWQR